MNTKYEEGKKKQKRKEKKCKLTQKQACAQRAQTKSRGNKVAVCWYDRSYVQLVDQQKDDTEIPDKTINRETELTQNGQSTNGQLVGQGYYCLSMKPGSMSRMLRCALQIFFISSIMSLDSMSPPFSSARYARQ